MRYDLAFFLCCCRSFLGENDNENSNSDNFYYLLGVETDASPDEIRRAYKRRSLQMHPDKLAQRGQKITEADRTRFTRMKDAYECLSDPRQRETYDVIGEKGMRWLSQPLSIDPEEIASNFARSSVLDRSKIFGIFVGLAVAVLGLPVLVCLHLDGAFGEGASWTATLTPLWIWNVLLLVYHCGAISMPIVPRPEDVPPEEWVDPFPMEKRLLSLLRFGLLVWFEVLLALKLDGAIDKAWAFALAPLWLREATIFWERWPVARREVITVSDLECALGKPLGECTPDERAAIGRRYSVVDSLDGPGYSRARAVASEAGLEMAKSGLRSLFLALLAVRLDGDGGVSLLLGGWSWWWIFAPIWATSLLVCLVNYRALAETRAAALEKHPDLFGGGAGAGGGAGGWSNGTGTGRMKRGGGGGAGTTTTATSAGAGAASTMSYYQAAGATTTSTETSAHTATATVIGNESGTTTRYGSVGADGTATPEQASASASADAHPSEDDDDDDDDEERKRHADEISARGSEFCSGCCSQGASLILLWLVVAKLQGAAFSTLWIISPLLFAAGIILCCLGCAIFGAAEASPDAYETPYEFVPPTVDDMGGGGVAKMDGSANAMVVEPTSPVPVATRDDDESGPIDDAELGGFGTTATATTTTKTTTTAMGEFGDGPNGTKIYDLD